MEDFKFLSEKSGIPLWCFEVANGRPLLTCTLSDVKAVRDYVRYAQFNSEEEHVGLLRLLELLTPLAEAATTDTELLFVAQNLPPHHTLAHDTLHDKRELAENPEYHRRAARERAADEAGHLKRLELSINTEDMWEVVLKARRQSTVSVQAALNAIVATTFTLSDLAKVFELSVFWHESHSSSVQRIIELHKAGTLVL